MCAYQNMAYIITIKLTIFVCLLQCIPAKQYLCFYDQAWVDCLHLECVHILLIQICVGWRRLLPFLLVFDNLKFVITYGMVYVKYKPLDTVYMASILVQGWKSTLHITSFVQVHYFVTQSYHFEMNLLLL